MKTLILIPLLFCSLGFGYWGKKEVTLQENNQIKGKWKTERIQIQYVVDSHLVYEQELKAERSKVLDFYDTTVCIKNPDGTTAKGTYSLVEEAEAKKLVLQVSATTTSYQLISVTPTHMVWQRDLDNVNYTEGQTQKSAERAIYTQVFKKVKPKELK